MVLLGTPPRAARPLACRAPATAPPSQGGKRLEQPESAMGFNAGEKTPFADGGVGTRAPLIRTPVLQFQGGKSVEQPNTAKGEVVGESTPLAAGRDGARVLFSRTLALQAAASLKPAGASRSLAEEFHAGLEGKTEQRLLCPPCLP